MKLFVSYARVDKPLCKQIVHRLEDIHEVWYDKRLHAGQDWWNEIQERLVWCEGFVYLLSPESVASDYCQKEFAIAVDTGKHIFPVLIQARTAIPDSLKHLQHADLSEGMEDMITLMNALTIAERRQRSTPPPPKTTPPVKQPGQPPKQDVTPALALVQAADALEAQNFDSAVFVIKQALDKQPTGRMERMLKGLLGEAETALEQQAYLREAEREYAPIRELVRREATRDLGCAEFADFRQDFPDYDPDDVASVCQQISSPPPDQRSGEGASQSDVGVRAAPTASADAVQRILGDPFDWCDVPAGAFLYGDKKQQLTLPAFAIAKYPITYRQFQAFIDAQDGFKDPRWWAGLAENQSDAPGTQEWKIDDHPRENVSWYDAVAFCRWLSSRLGGGHDLDRVGDWRVRLPTEFEWEKAARGTDGRGYPYGNGFDQSKGNTNESGIGTTTPVTQYPDGASPYGVLDMSGNVWEWCLTDFDNPQIEAAQENMRSNTRRVLRGGSWYSFLNDARAASRLNLSPGARSLDGGFRLCCVRAPSLKY